MDLKNKFIHFRKTTAVEFATEFREFGEWLYEQDGESRYINIDGIENGEVKLSRFRKRNYPKFVVNGPEEKLNNVYFLDDIGLIYWRGVPYDSASDYITGAEYTDSSTLTVDEDRHILLIPKPSNPVGPDGNTLNVAYIHQLDETGKYNPNIPDSSITVYTKGPNGQTFVIRQSMVEGSTTDEIDAISYWGLKNYIDDRLKDVNVEEIIDTEWKDEI